MTLYITKYVETAPTEDEIMAELFIEDILDDIMIEDYQLEVDIELYSDDDCHAGSASIDTIYELDGDAIKEMIGDRFKVLRDQYSEQMSKLKEAYQEIDELKRIHRDGLFCKYTAGRWMESRDVPSYKTNEDGTVYEAK